MRVVIDFLPAFILFLIVFGIGLLVLLFAPYAYTSSSSLTASMNNAWGIFTSIFVNDSFFDYVQETSGFLIGITFLMLSSWMFKSPERKTRALLYAIGSLFIGVIATEMWLFLPHAGHYSYGPSGVAYAGMGIVFSLTLTNLLIVALKLRRFREYTKMQVVLMAISPIIAFAIAEQVIFNPVAFFNIGPGVNSLLHELSFLFGVLGGAVYFYLTKSKWKE